MFEIEDNKMDIEYFVLEAITVTSPGKSIISVLNSSVPKNQLILKRGSLLGNEDPDIGGDSPIFEIEY